MPNVFYTNQITLQINDSEVRLVFVDGRPGLALPNILLHESPMVGGVVGEAVLSPATARGLRDLLVQHVKDDVPPMETPNV